MPSANFLVDGINYSSTTSKLPADSIARFSATGTPGSGIWTYATGPTGLVDVQGLVAAPASATSAASKAYVDSKGSGISWKTAAAAATTGPINVLTPPDVYDGITVTVVGTRVLVKDQASPSKNGLYLWQGTGVALLRAADLDTGAEFANAAAFVSSGDTLANSAWLVSSTGIVGTDNMTWVHFANVINPVDPSTATQAAVFSVGGQRVEGTASLLVPSTSGLPQLTLANTTNTYSANASHLFTQNGTAGPLAFSVTGAATQPLTTTFEATGAGGALNMFLNANATNDANVYMAGNQTNMTLNGTQLASIAMENALDSIIRLQGSNSSYLRVSCSNSTNVANMQLDRLNTDAVVIGTNLGEIQLKANGAIKSRIRNEASEAGASVGGSQLRFQTTEDGGILPANTLLVSQNGSVFEIGTVSISDNSAGTNSGDAALNVTGGGQFGGNMFINSATVSTGTTSGALVVVGGVGIGDELYVAGTTTTTTLDVSGSADVGTTLSVSSALDSTAVVGVGAFTVVGGAQVGKSLFVNGTTESTGVGDGAVVIAGGSTIQKKLFVNSTANEVVPGDGYALVVAGGATFVGDIYAAGYSITSDFRLKNITGDIKTSVEEFSSLHPVTFTWKRDTTDAPKVVHGFIAQEIEKILPDSVKTSSSTGFKSVDINQILPLVVSRVQQQDALIAQLAARLAALESA